MAKKPTKNGKQTELSTVLAAEVLDRSLADETQRRYLNYALSVITARALPDVRDGLKPVQRRILYAMRELGLRPDVKYRKCALVVGDVLGKFHPHGDSSVYDALVRLAQDFTMRATLVDGRGNFGSPDGDGAAAYRYTEARLTRVAMELLSELDKGTVAWRANFDNTREEPSVLPARFPHLLVNGSQGIAVGMATSIPPHNLGEVVDACIALIDEPDLPLAKVMKFVKGPDFPTGGQILSSRSEIQDVYENGQGSLRLRGDWKVEEEAKARHIVITAIPYSVERRAIVEKIAEVIIAKKLPILLDVRDESTEETRIVLEIKKDADASLVMSYLFKHTPLASNVQVNLTCLVPGESGVPGPIRLGLVAMLKHFLAFRLEVVTKRIGFDLDELKRRIHILDGFVTIFDALDEVIRIIRKSTGKKDAAEKLMKRFNLSAEQVEAILELKLYRLAQLEINLVRDELDGKRKEAARLEALLSSEKGRWNLIKAELHEIKATFGDKRRTKLGVQSEIPEYSEEAFIVDEDASVILTQQGWIKRQREVKDVTTTRVREGDSVLGVIAGSTKASVAFFSNKGVCYVSRIADVPATTGYGDPVQKLFKMDDGERIVAMQSFDPRVLEVPEATEGATDPEEPFAIAVTRGGLTLRFSLRAHRDPSTRAGRKFARLNDGDEVVYVSLVTHEHHLACATVQGYALICDAEEVGVLSGAGKGVMLIKLGKDDSVLAATTLLYKDDALVVENESGKKFEISLRKFEATSRGGKGHALFKRGQLKSVVPPELTVPGLSAPE